MSVIFINDFEKESLSNCIRLLKRSEAIYNKPTLHHLKKCVCPNKQPTTNNSRTVQWFKRSVTIKISYNFNLFIILQYCLFINLKLTNMIATIESKFAQFAYFPHKKENLIDSFIVLFLITATRFLTLCTYYPTTTCSLRAVILIKK